VPLYELITDFYAAIINAYLHIYSNYNSRHKLARNVVIYTTSDDTENCQFANHLVNCVAFAVFVKTNVNCIYILHYISTKYNIVY